MKFFKYAERYFVMTFNILRYRHLKKQGTCTDGPKYQPFFKVYNYHTRWTYEGIPYIKIFSYFSGVRLVF